MTLAPLEVFWVKHNFFIEAPKFLRLTLKLSFRTKPLLFIKLET